MTTHYRTLGDIARGIVEETGRLTEARYSAREGRLDITARAASLRQRGHRAVAFVQAFPEGYSLLFEDEVRSRYQGTYTVLGDEGRHPQWTLAMTRRVARFLMWMT